MSPFPTGLVFSDQLSAFFSLLPSPISPLPQFPTPHTPHPAFKQNLRLLVQTCQKMIVSDIGIIWLRKKMSSLAACWPKNISKY
ncbi:minus agglutinin domain protein [Microcystis aeruginosa FACHB-905 = DIANCHI905]|uniref:Uncharacterized protein n=1 Tax=Microcystis aeruginosa PCC 7806SL TaxID=1903187 RepID=A0AB33BMD8_MICA7|nr:hypothetical protein BH695_2328 [Microcystis aeruginosa PCC 7806SL]ELS47897.1 minus agglutinin domain protein [Microcystis aeruginosa FACHB-905 = DIANCHI905]